MKAELLQLLRRESALDWGRLTALGAGAATQRAADGEGARGQPHETPLLIHLNGDTSVNGNPQQSDIHLGFQGHARNAALARS